MFCTIIIVLFILTNCYAYNNDIEINTINITDGQIISETKTWKKLSIYCREASPRLLSNALMSSHYQFVETPNKFQLFANQNVTEIMRQYESEWISLMSWTDTRVAVPVFKYHCLAVLTQEPYKLHLESQHVNIWRLFLLISGFILFRYAAKLTRNVTFYYITCISIGLLASIILIILIIRKFLPRIGSILLLVGSPAVIFIYKTILDDMQHILKFYSNYLYIYIFCVVIASFAFGYRFGPISNPKTLNLLQWSLQLLGLILILMCSEMIEFSILIIIVTALLYKVPIKLFINFKRKNKPAFKYLSEKEFDAQSDAETKKALEQLKQYCCSPDCDAWKTIGKLRNPIRFSRFINGESHLTDDEIAIYEQCLVSSSFIETQHKLESLTDDLEEHY